MDVKFKADVFNMFRTKIDGQTAERLFCGILPPSQEFQEKKND